MGLPEINQVSPEKNCPSNTQNGKLDDQFVRSHKHSGMYSADYRYNTGVCLFVFKADRNREDKHLKQGILQGEIHIFTAFTLMEMSSPSYE